MRVLRVLHRNTMVDPALGGILVGSGRPIIPTISTPEGIYVERTDENEARLLSMGKGFISGTLNTSKEFPIFFRDDPHNFVQLALRPHAQIEISLSTFHPEGREIPLIEMMDSFCLLIDKYFGFAKSTVASVPLISSRGDIFQFELYELRRGHCRYVHLVHGRLGLVRLMLRRTYNSGIHSVTMEPRMGSII